MLATLTMDHRLDLCRPMGKLWEPFLDLSDLFHEYMKQRNYNDGCEELDLENKELVFRRFKQRIYSVAATGFVWSRIMESDVVDNPDNKVQIKGQFVFFIEAMNSGEIVILKIAVPCVDSSDVSVAHMFDTKLGIITSLSWQQINNNFGLLAVGSQAGQLCLFAVSTTWQCGVPTVSATLSCSPCDMTGRMSITCITFSKKADCSYILLAGKSTFLMAWDLSLKENNVTIKSTVHCNAVSRMPLTCICDINGTFLVTSRERCVAVTIENISGLSIRLEKVNLGTENVELMGLCSSPTGAFVCYLEKQGGFYDHLAIREPNKMKLFSIHSISYATLYLISRQDTHRFCDVVDMMVLIQCMICSGEDTPQQLQELLVLPLEKVGSLNDYLLMCLRWCLICLTSRHNATESSVDQLENIQQWADKIVFIEEELQKRYLLQKLKSGSDNKSKGLIMVACDWLSSRNLNDDDRNILEKLKETPGTTRETLPTACSSCNNDERSMAKGDSMDGKDTSTSAIHAYDEPVYLQCVCCGALANKEEWEPSARCVGCDGELRSNITELE